MESLNQEFVDMGYIPWTNGTAKTNTTKLNLIFQARDRYMLLNIQAAPAFKGSAGNI